LVFFFGFWIVWSVCECAGDKEVCWGESEIGGGVWESVGALQKTGEGMCVVW